MFSFDEWPLMRDKMLMQIASQPHPRDAGLTEGAGNGDYGAGYDHMQQNSLIIPENSLFSRRNSLFR